MRFFRENWFAVPTFEQGDDEIKYRARALNLALGSYLLITVLLFLGGLLGGRTPTSTLVLDVFIVAVCLTFFYLLRRGKIALVSYSVISTGLVLVTGSVASLGTIRTPTTALYLPLVIIGGILFKARGILVTAGLSSLAVLGLILAQNANLLPPPDYSVTITQWITYTMTFFIVGGLVYVENLIAQQAMANVTARKQIEDELQTSEASFRYLFEQTHDAVFLLDLNGKHIMGNQRAANMLGYSVEEISHLSIRDTSADLEDSQNIITRLVAGEAIPIYERIFVKKNRQAFPVEISVELVRDKDGNPHHIQSVVRDISERKRAEEELRSANEQLKLRMGEVEKLQHELREQALHDPLTGLYNRRYLSEILEREISRMERERTPLSIIAMDVDHFKGINDAFGHQAGDLYLIALAKLMERMTRPTDICCRYGGEEFLIVLPGTSLATARHRAEQIRSLCAEIVLHHEGKEIRTTMSLGLAAYPEHGEAAEQVLIKADKALYISKYSGRNRVTIWRDELPRSN